MRSEFIKVPFKFRYGPEIKEVIKLDDIYLPNPSDGTYHHQGYKLFFSDGKEADVSYESFVRIKEEKYD